MGVMCMNKVFTMTHGFQAIVGILFSIFIAYVAMDNLEQRSALAYGRLFLALTLFVYSASHIFLAIKKSISKVQFFSFLPIYILFGLTFSNYLFGYIKNWAPVTEIEANSENIEAFMVLSLIFVVGIISTTFKHETKNT